MESRTAIPPPEPQILPYGRGRKPRWRKWLLRTLFATLLLASTAAVVIWRARAAHRLEQPVIAGLTKLGATLDIRTEHPWRRVFGQEWGGYFDRVRGIDFTTAYNVDGTHLAPLPALKSLENVNLNLRLTGDKEMPILAKLTNLRVLRLENGSVGDKSAAHWASFPKMRVLHLQDCHVTDKSVPALKKMTSLRELNIRGTFITQAGVKELQAALPQCKIDRITAPGGG
jgi:hypothetical protein